MKYSIREGTPQDATQIVALLPRLADINVPEYRVPEHLWHGDRSMIQQWARGERPEVEVAIATVDDDVVGIAVVSAKNEMLSGLPSLHLETLAISVEAEGHGIGAALMRETDSIAQRKGATGISLHVFSANMRARALYERHGYQGELIRYFKPIN